ncbi:cobalamin biosynthesis protein [Methylorubrum extorquens]|uniref:Putative CobE protein n=1 Tax=Methylorubrum extorquens (strain CM4 / NCIMB 13688) TaxID=440085 RepID=B7L3J8_METC4|nr:putative CobE protein [Methylorubrum extorquens CM4]
MSALVAGIGFRRGTPAAEIVALLGRALGEAASVKLWALATANRADEPARAFGLVALGVAPEALAAIDVRVPTRSPRIEQLRGVGSLAEAAVLAAAGVEARLILPRIASAGATCALARTEPRS